MDKTLASYFSIDRGSPVPLYYQLKSQLLHLFDQGYYKAGDKLPTEAELCELLDISRPTVRQAFSELINEGYITRKKAKGTFVAERKIEGYFFQKLGSYQEEMESLGLHPSTKVLQAEIISHRDIESNIFRSDRVFHLRRLRYADDKEMVLVDTYLPYERFRGIEKIDFEKYGLYDVLKKQYQCEISYVDRVVEARKVDEEDGVLLKMESDGVILHVVTTAYDDHDQPVEYSIASYRGDRNTFKMRLTRQ